MKGKMSQDNFFAEKLLAWRERCLSGMGVGDYSATDSGGTGLGLLPAFCGAFSLS